MADRLETMATRLAQRLKDHASQSVTLRRGAVTATAVKAVPDRALYPPGEGPVIARWQDASFLIDAADYAIGTAGAVDLPLRGDELDIVIGGVTVTYEVQKDRDESVYEYADAYRKKLRVHYQQKS